MNIGYLPLKLIFFTLLLWPISRVWLRFKDGGIKFGMFLFWTAVWLAGVFAVFFPGFLTYVAELAGIGRGSDMALYVSVAVLFYLVFRTNVTVENVKHDISKVVMEVALSNSKSTSTQSSPKTPKTKR
ncbi:MAG: DUF2304 domain-containing protein [Patescibacteria group bacterium]|jgi:hypothetical protein